MVLRTQFLRIKLQGIFNVRILHSLNLIKRKDNVTPYNTFEDNRKILVRHTIQYLWCTVSGGCRWRNDVFLIS